MSQLIEQFLKTHQRCTGLRSIMNISTELDQEAISIYYQAETEMEWRLIKEKTFNVNQKNKIFYTALSARLSQLLAETDLLNSDHYETLTHAIKNWCPWQVKEQKNCLYLQDTLLKLLPLARKKQEIDQLCQEYQHHLKSEIENEMQDHHKQAYGVYSNNQSALFKWAAESHPYIKNPHIKLSKALQKYQAVSELRNALMTPSQSANEQLQNFQQIFTAKRQILEKDRDSHAMKFAKGIVTLLSLGVAWFLGVWDVEGKMTTEKMQNILEP